MKSRYRGWLWFVVVMDVLLLTLILWKAPDAIPKWKARLGSSGTENVQAVRQENQALTVKVLLPENITVERDYPVTIQLCNQSSAAIGIRSVVLPADLMENNQMVTSDPIVDEASETDSGWSFSLSLNLQPQEEKSLIFILRPVKMQSLHTRVLVRTSVGDQQIPLLIAVAPESQAQPYVNEAFPYKSLVKLSAMYHDENGELQVGWTGLGTIISADGLILTDAHLVLPNRSLPVDAVRVALIQARDVPPVDMYTAEVLQADYYLDLAVIRITADINGKAVDKAALQLPAVELGNASALELGKRVAVLGLQDSTRQYATQINGNISGFRTQTPYGEKALAQISAEIPASFSGGMVLDEHGKLVGVPVMYVSPRGVVGESECRYLADTNADRQINNKDLCMPSQPLLGGLRSIDLFLPMIEAATKGETKIYGFPHDLLQFPHGSKILLEDNFQDVKSGWVNATGAEQYADYKNGEYQISLNHTGLLGVGVYQNKKFTGSIVRAHVHEETSSDNAFYGMVCRFTDRHNYYLFAVSTDGRYSIQKVENDQFSVMVPWTYSPIVPVHIDLDMSAACVDTALMLEVNGIPLAEVKNSSHWRGLTGLAAGTFDSQHSVVLFDDVMVQSP